jgi:hypothetical protein
MNNQLDFTQQMKEMMCDWKGKNLQSYIENADDGFVTVVRLHIDNKNFNIENDYVLYVEPDGESIEFTCFSCTEVANNYPLVPAIVGGKNKENIIEERIKNIFIVREIEMGEYHDDGNFEFSHEKALVLQTEHCFYAFWRHLIFNTIQILVCKDLEEALKNMKELNEGEESMDGIATIKKKIVEKI